MHYKILITVNCCKCFFSKIKSQFEIPISPQHTEKKNEKMLNKNLILKQNTKILYSTYCDHLVKSKVDQEYGIKSYSEVVKN